MLSCGICCDVGDTNLIDKGALSLMVSIIFMIQLCKLITILFISNFFFIISQPNKSECFNNIDVFIFAFIFLK